MKREEIQAVYEGGIEAVIRLVEQLESCRASQDRIIEALTARVKELEDRLAKDSHNSSKPPSSDSFRKTKSLRQEGQRKPGGQKGHEGSTLRLVSNPDCIVEYPVKNCQSCGKSLQEVGVIDHERRQVFDLPPLKMRVVEHRAQVKECPGCGQKNKGEFPEDVTNIVQYGDRLKSLAVYMQEYQLMPYDRTREFFEDVFGGGVCEATSHSAIKTCYEGLEQTEEKIKQGIKEADVAHFDETGMYVQGKRQWVHVASTEQLTHYARDAKRGKDATEAIGILPQFRGTSVHDGYGSYPRYENCNHSLCNAHHLRELIFIQEQYQQPWAGKMKELVLEIKTCVEEHKVAGFESLAQGEVEEFEQRYQAIVEEGLEANPLASTPEPKKRGRKKQTRAKNLLDRLSSKRPAVLAFMYDFRVPFDNNLAERDLRMIKVQQKISGCFRSPEGADYFCRIRGYISTMKKQREKVLAAIERVFAGNPFVPSLYNG